MPRFPRKFEPQLHTVPSLSKAIPCREAAAIATTPESPLTWTGDKLSILLPSPNSPLAFLPHPQTVLSSRSARECCDPPATASAPLKAVT